ncbi:MAG: hypothetical protein WBF36_13020 [Desulfobulbales bacterium]
MGKLLIRKWGSFFLVLMLAVSVSMLTGCSGDDGAPGPPGADGAPGAPGVPSTTNESCNVCHGADKVVDIAVAHPAPLIKPIVSNIRVTRSAADALTVTFRVDYEDEDGVLQPLPGIMDAPGDAGNIRVYMADLVPAGTPTVNLPQSTWGGPITWPTGFFEMWAEERGTTPGAIATDNGDGTYSFRMVATPADIGPGGDAPEGDITDTQRVYVRADARDIEGFNRTMGVADFTMPAPAANTPVLNTTTRTIVDASACTACHGDPLEQAAHGGGYQSPQVCNMCHSPIGIDGDVMQDAEAWLASLIHKIHAAIPMDAFPNRIDGRGYGAVTYPKNIKDCETCHFDAGQDLADAWMNNPTIEVCTTCHVDTTFTVDPPATHTGGSQANNNGCRLCHPAAGSDASVTVAHAVTTLKHNPAEGWDGSTDPVSITPNYTSTIALSPAPGAGGFYAAGDEILVTVTTSNMAAGDYDVPGGTSRANLYVYGPRAKAVPVLATGTAQDLLEWTAADGVDADGDPECTEGGEDVGNGDGICDQAEFDAGCCSLPTDFVPTQGHSILVDSSDPQVRTDADGFKYQLFAIPDDLAPGTYMVMAYVTTDLEDCSGIYRGSVCIDGWQLTTFQVGTADDELRVAGPLGDNDATPGCANCHDQADWGTFYHRSYFGTDGCIACHDQSGNHADPIANRVHAVHAACPDCDLLGPVDMWAEVTFPRNLGSCDACHTSGNQSFINGEPAAWSVPCIGCHGGTAGSKDHMIQNGAPFTAH